MQKESMKEKLEEYCRETISNSEYGGLEYDWAYGAIDFARSADLISGKERGELMEEFRLLG